VYSPYSGVYSNLADSVLVNHGYIFGGSDDTAVLFEGDNCSIDNGTDGTIRALFGIQVAGADGGMITNHGAIIGFAEGVAFYNSQGDSLINRGYIYGVLTGVFAGALLDDPV